MLSGSSHVRYDHRSRARILHVACPRCQRRAEAKKESELEKGNVIGDTEGTWELSDWSIVCHACPFRQSSLAYEQLPDLFCRLDIRGIAIWAWNFDHLQMLLRLLNHESIDGDPYRWFATYAHGDWLRESNRSAIVKKLRQFLAEHDSHD